MILLPIGQYDALSSHRTVGIASCIPPCCASAVFFVVLHLLRVLLLSYSWSYFSISTISYPHIKRKESILFAILYAQQQEVSEDWMDALEKRLVYFWKREQWMAKNAWN